MAGRDRARPRQSRRSAAKARITRRRSCSRSSARSRHLAMLDPKTRQVHLRRHLLRHAPSAVRLRRQRHAVDERRRAGRRLAQHEEVRRDRRRRDARRAGRPLVLDTNGNGRRDDYVEPNQPVDPAKDKRVNAGFYAVMPSPVDGSIWGSFRGRTERRGAPRPGRESAGDRAGRDLQRAAARLRRARRRHRHARAWSGCRSPAATSAASTAASARRR